MVPECLPCNVTLGGIPELSMTSGISHSTFEDSFSLAAVTKIFLGQGKNFGDATSGKKDASIAKALVRHKLQDDSKRRLQLTAPTNLKGMQHSLAWVQSINTNRTRITKIKLSLFRKLWRRCSLLPF